MTLSIPVIVMAVAIAFFALEALFFVYCLRWLSSGKKLREKEFARLDFERNELSQLQNAVAQDLSSAKHLAHETLSKLTRIGADAHAEWTEMTARIDQVMSEIEGQTARLLEEHTALATRNRLALEKVCKEARETNVGLQESLRNSRKLLRFFDKNVPAEQIVKELQTEKYAEAKKLIEQGIDASAIAKKLGLSQSEVSLLATLR